MSLYLIRYGSANIIYERTFDLPASTDYPYFEAWCEPFKYYLNQLDVECAWILVYCEIIGIDLDDWLEGGER